MKRIGLILSMFIFLAGTGQQVCAQGILKKIKNKTEDKVINGIFGEDNNSNNNQNPSGNTDNPTGGPTNTRGSGLNAKSIDVMENIDLASNSFSDKKFTDARYSVREAILGIELEIGKNILKDMPESIDGMPAVTDEDNVTSSGIGFVGLIIERTYREGDKELKVTVGNDAGMLSAVNMYFAAGYSSTSTDDNVQRTKFKEEPAIIEYDESSGYKLSVPFGQSSILVTEGINFENQDEFVTASEKIDLDNIKKQLGEQ